MVTDLVMKSKAWSRKRSKHVPFVAGMFTRMRLLRPGSVRVCVCVSLCSNLCLFEGRGLLIIMMKGPDRTRPGSIEGGNATFAPPW